MTLRAKEGQLCRTGTGHSSALLMDSDPVTEAEESLSTPVSRDLLWLRPRVRTLRTRRTT
jgi:hypothetical protein